MKKYFILMITVALSSLLIVGCGKAEQPEPEEKSIAVTVQAAKDNEIENKNTFSGTTKIKDETSVTVEAGGIIESMNVELGQHVSKGDTLLTIKGTDVENSIKTAEAALQTAQAAYNDSDKTIENSQNQLDAALKNAQLTYDKAKTSYEETKRQFDLNEQLYQAGGITEDAYKQLQAGLDQAQKAVDQAQAGLDQAQKSYDTGVSSREQAQAAIQQSQVAYDNAVSARDKLTLKAPVSGVITTKNFEVNEMASQSQPAFVITSSDTLQIDLNVTQSDIDKFSEGQTVDVIIADQTVEGTVNYVPSVTGANTSLYTVQIVIDNSNGEFKAGMSADVEVSIEKQENAVTVPKKAIVEEDGLKYVYIVSPENRTVKKEITTGIETESKVEIVSGVDADDTIVIGGLSLIADDTKVFPVVKED